MGPLLHVLDIY